MKAIFAHDHRFIPKDGDIWSESQFEAGLWARYVRHFHQLTVVARRGAFPEGRQGSELERSSVPGVAFELFPNLSSPRGLLITYPRVRKRMDELVARHDAVIARLPSEIGLLAITSARRLNRLWAVEVVGCPWDGLWNYGSAAGKLYAPLAYRRMRKAVARADHAIYVTRDFLQRRYPTRARNVSSASNVILPETSPDILAARKARIARRSEAPLRLGLIGTLRGKFKGIQTLLAALAIQRTSLPLVRLHILGGGDIAPWRAEAERLGVADLLSFDGTLPAGEPVLRWLDNIDIYLQPSLKEGLPRALIEAMSRGCPSIASTVAGIPELLPREDLIVPGDTAALATLLRTRADDTGWMAERAERNWHEAQRYRSDVLEERRRAFWSAFTSAACERLQLSDHTT